jgi:mRNA interferase RelE/StbE
LSRYRVFVTPQALKEIKDLPGHIRQRVKSAVKELASQPRPPQSKLLESNIPNHDLFRLRLDNWRLVYAITNSENVIDILAVRKRPPYDYGDLEHLIDEIE